MAIAEPVPRTNHQLADGLKVPLAPRLGKSDELRHAVPPTTAEIMDAARRQIETEVLTPLLYAPDLQRLGADFVALYPKFEKLYMSVWFAVGATPEVETRLPALAIQALEKLRDSLRQKGPRWLGTEASAAGLLGLYAITSVTALVRRAREIPQEAAIEVSQLVIAYMMSFAAVDFAVSAEHDDKRGRRECAIQLALWSKAYALRAYALIAKELRLSTQGPPGGKRVPEASTPEDLEFAAVALREYQRLIAEEGDAKR